MFESGKQGLINKLKRLYQDAGIFVTMIRLPFKIIKTILDYLTTYYYFCLLNKAGHNLYVEFGVKITAPNRVSVGDNVYIGKGVEVLSETSQGRLVIGNNVEIGRMCRIDITGNLTIRNNVHFSRGCQISTHTHGHNPKSQPVACGLVVEDDVWFGAEVFVMDSCRKIEKNSLLATRAVLTKSILEKNSIFAGLPAKLIGYRSD